MEGPTSGTLRLRRAGQEGGKPRRDQLGTGSECRFPSFVRVAAAIRTRLAQVRGLAFGPIHLHLRFPLLILSTGSLISLPQVVVWSLEGLFGSC